MVETSFQQRLHVPALARYISFAADAEAFNMNIIPVHGYWEYGR